MRLKLPKHLRLDSFDVVSTDIFDTLLFRDCLCERRRFAFLAATASERLRTVGVDVTPATLLRARRDIQLAAYRAVETRSPPGDVGLRHMLTLLTQILNLPATAVEILLDNEISGDAATLRPNMALIDELMRLKRGGARVIAVSDTYYSEATLAYLLDKTIGRHPIAQIYSSADLFATKKNGQLYRKVLIQEGVPANKILHVGDNRHADVVMAGRMGLQACLLSRPASVQGRRRADAISWRLGRPSQEWGMA